MFVALGTDDPLEQELTRRLGDRCGGGDLILDPTRPDSALLDDLRRALADAPPPILAGFSRGARLAATVADELDAGALVAFGYPFHRRGSPRERHGWEVLRGLRTPTLVIQGERDPHGSRTALRGWTDLPPIHWVPDGNHRLEPRVKSGLAASQLLDEAFAVCADFVRTHG